MLVALVTGFRAVRGPVLARTLSVLAKPVSARMFLPRATAIQSRFMTKDAVIDATSVVSRKMVKQAKTKRMLKAVAGINVDGSFRFVEAISTAEYYDIDSLKMLLVQPSSDFTISPLDPDLDNRVIHLKFRNPLITPMTSSAQPGPNSDRYVLMFLIPSVLATSCNADLSY